MGWKEILQGALRNKRSLLCIGLDTDMSKFEEGLLSGSEPQFSLNRRLIDATHRYAAAYKLNMAFYEVEGEQGIRVMERTIAHIIDNCPDTLVVLDGKKGDIGNTSSAYAKAAFERFGAHAVTLNGYMGLEAVSPFANYRDRLSFILCRTSNKSASEVQDIGPKEAPFYLQMARLVKGWNTNGNLGLVVGATFPEELARVRSEVGPSVPILVPGVGAQGGDLGKVLAHGTDQAGGGVLINVSRDIMFAYQRPEMKGLSYEEAAGKAVKEYHTRISSELVGSGKWRP